MCMYMYIMFISLCEFMYTTCIQGPMEASQKVLDTLKLELPMVVSQYVGARN